MITNHVKASLGSRKLLLKHLSKRNSKDHWTNEDRGDEGEDGGVKSTNP
jgi:hypothetical protein